MVTTYGDGCSLLFDFREFALIAVQQLVASEIGGEEEEDGAAEGEGEPGEDV